jgi:hypothetical protein
LGKTEHGIQNAGDGIRETERWAGEEHDGRRIADGRN